MQDICVGLGNHDVENCKILFTEMNYKGHSLWRLPSSYYEIWYEIANDVKIQILMIDTNMYSLKEKVKKGKTKTKYQKTCSGEDYTVKDRILQSQWILETLKGLPDVKTWRIIVGHIPLFARGHKKERPWIYSPLLDQYVFEPIQESKIQIHAYVAADEHNQQFLYYEKPQMALVVARSDGAKLDSKFFTSQQEPIQTLYSSAIYGFVTLTFTQESLRIAFLNTGNTIEAAFTLDVNGNLV